MQPIHELLNRIRWDQDFGKGDFTIGYYDRVLGGIITIPLRELHFDPEDHFRFQLVGEEGEILSVPYHRIREVHKDGKLIWRRQG